MLDVHPPHHATHSWRDFFIHIATIVVGLLIAIGLEQTVETLHRLHERHVLEGELRVECETDNANAEIDIAEYDARMTWLLGLKQDIDTMLVTGGKANLPYRQFHSPPHLHDSGSGLLLIVSNVWETAKSDGRLALLPDGAKATYGVFYRHIDQYSAGNLTDVELARQQQAFADQFSELRPFGVPVLSRMSADQLIAYRRLVMEHLEQTRATKRIVTFILGDLSFLLAPHPNFESGPELTQRLLKAENEARNAHPDDFARMADAIDAEDAARQKAAAKPVAKAPK